MIKLIYIPSLLDEENRDYKELEYDPNLSLYDYVRLAGFLSPEFKVILDGEVVEVINLKDVRVGEESEIVVYYDIEDVVSIGAAVWAAVTAVASFVVANWYYILVIGYTAYNYMNQPSRPSFGTTGDGIEEGSPTYGWDGIRTTQNVEVPVPVIYGKMRVGGNVINQYVSSDGDKNYLNTLLALCEGEIEEIGDIYINENPSVNFDGIDTYTRLGTNSQTIIPSFQDIHDVYSVGVTLTKDNPYTYTTVNSDIEAIEINLTANGLFQADSGTGKILAWEIVYKVEYKLSSSGTWTDLGETTISAKTQSVLRRTYRIEGLTPGQYDVRVTRTSDNPSLDPQKVGQLDLVNVDEITTDDLSYPNTALLGVRALATDQLSGNSPNYNVDVKGRKVSVPDVRVGVSTQVAWEDYYYDGTDFRLIADDTLCTWDGTTYYEAWSANPIWCLKDLITHNRYGLGQYIDVSNLDDALLVEQALHCEELVPDGDGGQEKRYRLDVILDSKTKAFDILTQLCSTFNAYPSYAGGKISFSVDRLKTPTQFFGMGNIKRGSFKQTWRTIRERYNFVEVTFNNEDDNYRRETIAYDGEGELRTTGEPDNVLSISAFTTKMSYVIRQARQAFLIAKYVDRTVTFTTSINGIACSVGDVIGVSHDIPQWGESGTVLNGATTTSIPIDRTVTVEAAKTYKLLIQFQDGTIEEQTVTNIVGDHSTITVASAFNQTPQPGDSYSFGESNYLQKEYKVVSLSRKNDFEIDISAIEYFSELFDDSDITLPTNNTSQLNRGVPNVSDLTLLEDVGVNQDGSTQPIIIVSWSPPVVTNYDVNAYEGVKIFLSDNNGDSYELVGQTEDFVFNITQGLNQGTTYTVKAVSYGSGFTNAISNSPFETILLDGVPDAPADVSNFTYNFDELLVMSWTKNVEPNVAGYEIRTDDTNWGVDNANLVFRGDTNTYTYGPASRTPGTHYLRAFNRSGEYSDASITITPSNDVPDAPTSFGATVYFNYAKLAWNNSTDSDVKKYEVYKSETNAWSGEEELDSETVGNDAIVEGRAPRAGDVDSATTTTIVDSSLIGLPDDYFEGDRIDIVDGTGNGQSKTVTAFEGTTGTITVDTPWTTTPDATSKYYIFNTVYYKVRAVDTYGAGAFTAAQSVTYENITEDMLGDNTVTARKIFVGCLSAISANMGEITAGTVTGATIQTACDGARTVIDGTSIKSYDATCVKQLEICNGNLWARSLCLVDPACDCNYSYLDAGALKFHDALGNVPYVKRICSGFTNSGCTVELCGWTTSPEIQVSPKSISTFRKDYAAVNQVLCVYHDNLQYFCTAADCYGYCFDVYAKIVQESGQTPEAIKDVNFGTIVCTNPSTCQTCVRFKFEYWCNNAAPSNYYAGNLCYDICYRKSGDTIWCSCSFTYNQPYTSEGALKTTYDEYQNMVFACAETWEIMACRTGLSWTDTGICATTSVNCLCTRSVSAGSTLDFGLGCLNYSGSFFDSRCTPHTFSGSQPSNVYKAYVCICSYSLAPKHLCLYVSGTNCCARASSISYISMCNCEVANVHICGGNGVSYQGCCTFNSYDCYYLSPNYTYNDICHRGQLSINACNGSSCATLCTCLQCATLYQCYTVYQGAAQQCIYEKLYSLCDCTDYQVSLDPNGIINWLAIAYS